MSSVSSFFYQYIKDRWGLCGQTYFPSLQGMFSEAAHAVTNPTHPPRSKKEDLRRHLQLASSLFCLGKYSSAVERVIFILGLLGAPEDEAAAAAASAAAASLSPPSAATTQKLFRFISWYDGGNYPSAFFDGVLDFLFLPVADLQWTKGHFWFLQQISMQISIWKYPFWFSVASPPRILPRLPVVSSSFFLVRTLPRPKEI